MDGGSKVAIHLAIHLVTDIDGDSNAVSDGARPSEEEQEPGKWGGCAVLLSCKNPKSLAFV